MSKDKKKEQEERAVKAIMEEVEKQDSGFATLAMLAIFLAFYGSPIFGSTPTPMSEKEQIAYLMGKVDAYEKKKEE